MGDFEIRHHCYNAVQQHGYICNNKKMHPNQMQTDTHRRTHTQSHVSHPIRIYCYLNILFHFDNMHFCSHFNMYDHYHFSAFKRIQYHRNMCKVQTVDCGLWSTLLYIMRCACALDTAAYNFIQKYRKWCILYLYCTIEI